MLVVMSNYGQQPPYGQNPYGQPPQPNPYGQQPPNPYGAQPPRPGQPPYGQAPSPYGQPQQPYPQQPPPYAPPQPGQQPVQPAYGQPAAGGQWPDQPPTAAPPTISQHPVPVVTMDSLPGRDIEEVLGEVVGVVARTRELRPDLRGGNIIEGYATMLTESRQDAVVRLVEMAQRAGATAVVGLRFDCSEITQSLSEVAAYGTAVRLAPLEDEEESAAAESGSADETGHPADSAESGADQQTTVESQSAGQRPAEQQPGSNPESRQQWPPASWPSGT